MIAKTTFQNIRFFLLGSFATACGFFLWNLQDREARKAEFADQPLFSPLYLADSERAEGYYLAIKEDSPHIPSSGIERTVFLTSENCEGPIIQVTINSDGDWERIELSEQSSANSTPRKRQLLVYLDPETATFGTYSAYGSHFGAIDEDFDGFLDRRFELPYREGSHNWYYNPKETIERSLGEPIRDTETGQLTYRPVIWQGPESRWQLANANSWTEERDASLGAIE